MYRKTLALLMTCGALLTTGVATRATAAELPATWDNLVLAPSKGGAVVYLAPDADFRAYSKIQIDPTEVAFSKNWVRDYNSGVTGLDGRLDSSDVKRMTDLGRTNFQDVFAQAFTKAGYQVVTAPGPDVLRLRTAVIDVTVTAPDQMSAGRGRTFSVDAGQATLVVEARDSMTGAILARAVDRRIAGDGFAQQRTSFSNRSDFRQLFALWAKRSVARFTELKALSPAAVATSGKTP